MIDTLLTLLPVAKRREAARRLGLPSPYGFVTLHRPSNVDDPTVLGRLLELLKELSRDLPLVFAIHPRTREAAFRAGLEQHIAPGRRDFMCVGPLPYIDTLSLVAGARLILTDSGGLQEESSVLGVPCLTLRENTERPITVELGTSRLVGADSTKIREAFHDALRGDWPAGSPIPLWDGAASRRIAREIAQWLTRMRTTFASEPHNEAPTISARRPCTIE
jgi:UDP-N-acetylglucosamine 2-epimerase (non-hydrolysing)